MQLLEDGGFAKAPSASHPTFFPYFSPLGYKNVPLILCFKRLGCTQPPNLAFSARSYRMADTMHHLNCPKLFLFVSYFSFISILDLVARLSRRRRSRPLRRWPPRQGKPKTAADASFYATPHSVKTMLVSPVRAGSGSILTACWAGEGIRRMAWRKGQFSNVMLLSRWRWWWRRWGWGGRTGNNLQE